MATSFDTLPRAFLAGLRRAAILPPRLRGSFDGVRWGRAIGWLVDRDRPARRHDVVILLNGRAIGRGPADLPRPDLEAAGLGADVRGFSIAIALPPGAATDRLSALAAGRVALPRPEGFLVEDESIAGSFEAISGQTAVGWAASRDGTPVALDVWIGGRVVARTVARSFRDDVRRAGYGGGEAGFFVELPAWPPPGDASDVSIRPAGSAVALQGSPRAYRMPSAIERWQRRPEQIASATLARLRRWSARATGGLSLSIIAGPDVDLPLLAEDLADSWSDAWDVLAPDAATFGLARARSVPAAGHGFWTDAIRMARGDYVILLQAGDRLRPDAIGRLLAVAREQNADLVYADEAVIEAGSHHVGRILGRGAFSPDNFLAKPDLGGAVAIRRVVAITLLSPSPSMTLSDLKTSMVLGVMARGGRFAHAPGPAIVRCPPADLPLTRLQLNALENYLALARPGATASAGAPPGTARIAYPDPGGPVAVVIPTRDGAALLRAAVASVERTTSGEDVRIVVVDHESRAPETVALLAELRRRHRVVAYRGPFNFAAMNNLAVREAAGDCPFVLLMNNDVEAIEPGWLERLRSIAARPDVGAVGATLIYPDERVQHAGVVLGLRGEADHAHRFVPLRSGGDRTPGHEGALVTLREVSAVTAACLMLRRSVFEAVGGFDEQFAVGLNDIDLCLRIREAGLAILCDGETVLMHRESASRAGSGDLRHPDDSRLFKTRWRHVLDAGDPFYSPLLTLTGADHTVADPMPRRCSPRIRTVLPIDRPVGEP